MVSPLAGSLAKTVGSAFKGLFLDATLARTTLAAGPNAWTPGSPTTTTYSCKAIHDTWGASWLSQGLVVADEVKLLILASSLAVDPDVGDVVTIRGEAFTISPNVGGKPAVSTDPAKAVWECRAKK